MLHQIMDLRVYQVETLLALLQELCLLVQPQQAEAPVVKPNMSAFRLLRPLKSETHSKESVSIPKKTVTFNGNVTIKTGAFTLWQQKERRHLFGSSHLIIVALILSISPSYQTHSSACARPPHVFRTHPRPNRPPQPPAAWHAVHVVFHEACGGLGLVNPPAQGANELLLPKGG